jgi:hypothetical protein
MKSKIVPIAGGKAALGGLAGGTKRPVTKTSVADGLTPDHPTASRPGKGSGK